MKTRLLAAWLLLASSAGMVRGSHVSELENDLYTLRTVDNHRVVLSHRDAGDWSLEVSFCIMFAEADPQPAMRSGGLPGARYNVVTWENKDLKANEEPSAQVEDFLSVGDGFDPRILEGSKASRTANLFHAAPQVYVSPEKVERKGQSFVYAFPKHPLFKLQATLSLPQGNAAPVLRYAFTPSREGYYSVGYVGAPGYALDDLDEIWQPLVWQEKRFPGKSIMTLAYRCTVPSALITRQGSSLGVVVDSREFPFDPLPTRKNSRFGVALRNREGLAQPMVFAPVLGGTESYMKAGTTFTFTLRPTAVKGDTTDAFETIARDLYGFHDYRRNALCSLNTTLENMVAYGMSHWSRFMEDQKGCNYSTDAPGAVKNVSSLNPLEMAVVTDNEDIFNRRAYPYIEYMLSRRKFLFTTDEKQRNQSPSYTLEGPCAPVTELAVLYGIFNQATPVFKALAEREYASRRGRNLDVEMPGKTWGNALALYRVTGEQEYLDFALEGADDYIRRRVETPQTNFKDPDEGRCVFWTSFVPKFIPLVELYEVTGEQRYLDAAREGARRFAQFAWMCPAIPNEKILVNKGGKAPLYWYLKGKGHKQMHLPEEEAPAWRLSEIGLTPESSATCGGHRAIFMANYAPWLIRIGHHSGDAFLREVGRSAVIGRYRNFPGYHINTARTTAYEKADYPLREHKELSVNSFHYNHIWPMMSMLVDYLLTETMARSDGAVNFPSQYIEGYGYMQNKYYGAAPGRFYQAEDAVLWMPKGLLEIDDIEVNYIAARGKNALYLALMNESAKTVRTKVSLNEKRVPRGRYPMRAWSHGGDEVRNTTDGTFEVEIPPRGLTAVVLEGIKITPEFQQKVTGLAREDAWRTSWVDMAKPKGRAMMLSLGQAARTVYIYLENSKRDFQTVDLLYDCGSGTQRLSDDAFPWEFTVPIDAGVEQFTFRIAGITPGGRRELSEPYVLSRASGSPVVELEIPPAESVPD